MQNLSVGRIIHVQAGLEADGRTQRWRAAIVSGVDMISRTFSATAFAAAGDEALPFFGGLPVAQTSGLLDQEGLDWRWPPKV